MIGNSTGIYNGTFFELGPEGNVKIGNYCTIVGAIFNTNDRILIGDYVFVAHEVTMAQSEFATPHHGPANKSREIIIGDDVWIGARSIILGGARIGSGSIVGAATVVDFDVPPLCLVAGNPGRIIRAVA